MGSVYGVPKELKHYGCMADLLARAGLIKEAIGDNRECQYRVVEKAAARIMEIRPEDGGVYLTMADGGMINEDKEVEGFKEGEEVFCDSVEWCYT
ncbi:hypothetical protein HanPI659440_Chr16g0619821 [Helianthus annuus]|nr:hypothetical protein HanPI659440_Chr16g0619821 [Helianthus annuus]